MTQTLPVYFLKNVDGLAKAGEVKSVSASYARNVLLPKGLGEVATPRVLAEQEKRRAKLAREEQKRLKNSTKLAESLKDTVIALDAPADEQGSLYAAVQEKDVARAVQRQLKRHIEPSWVTLLEPIKHTGEYAVQITIGATTHTLPLTIHKA